MIGANDQMERGPRFIWMYPPTINSAKISESPSQYIFEGEIEAFKHVRKGIRHKRTITKDKKHAVWFVEDCRGTMRKAIQSANFGILPLIILL